MNKSSFFAELQRRNVYKVGAMYCVGGWLLVQIATQVFPFFDISNAAVRWVVLGVIAGFPVAVVLAWVFDITPQGIVRTADAGGTESPMAARVQRGMDRRLNYVLGGLLLIGAGYIALDHALPRGLAAQRAGGGKDDKSIAVLPFRNLSPDPDNAYFAEGMQDEILTRLSGIGALKVVSRTSTAHYASAPDNLPEIARQLGVANIVEGSVQKAGDQVHINVQLIHAASDEHLWAQVYDRKLDNVFGVEGEVAGAVAEALSAKLSGKERDALKSLPTRNQDAWDAYLRGVVLYDRDESLPDLIESERALRTAVQLDPNLALAWAKLVQVYGCYFIEEWDTSEARRAQARQALDNALRLQPEAVETRIAQAYYAYWVERDYAAARAQFERILEQQPNNSSLAQALAFVTRRQGHWQASLALFRKAVALDPHQLESLTQAAITAQSLGQDAEALQYLDKAKEIAPDNSNLVSMRAFVLMLAGRLEESDRLLNLIQPEAAEPFQLKVVCAQLWLQRRPADGIALMRGVLARVEPEQHRQRAVYGFYLGEFQQLAGQTVDARTTEAQARAEALEVLSSQGDSPDILDVLSLIDARFGSESQARTWQQNALAATPRGGDALIAASQQNTLARMEAHLGHDEAVLAALRTMLTLPDINGVSRPLLNRFTLGLDPDFDGLRQNPGFQKLLADAAVTAKADVRP